MKQTTKQVHALTSIILVGAVFLLLQGCGKSPVEEIASAEAALQAAREAKAPTRVPSKYQEAEQSMVETYRLNDDRDYKQAKDQAVETRILAEKARDAALQGDGSESDAPTDGEANTEAETDAAIESESIGSGSLEQGQRITSLKPVYFDFDNYVVESTQMEQLTTTADWLKQNPTATVTLEGHTDERGAADYNLTLATKRAKSVKEVLVSLGIATERLTTRSYGEELPADPGHDETAWQLNRRVEFVINP